MPDRMPALMLPDEPVPVQFVNTIWADKTGVHDDLSDSADLARWVKEVLHRAVGTPSRIEFEEARRLRDALRRLAALATADSRAGAQSAVDSIDEAIDVVDRALEHRPGVRLVMQDGRIRTEQASRASPVRTALAAMAEEALGLVASDGTSLRACHAPGCVLYFVKTHPRREWCSDGCGNRVRAARHYRRVRVGGQG